MARALCRQCRREISVEESFCPHCGVRDPADLSRAENWASSRDPRNLPHHERAPLRFFLVAVLIFVLIAAALAAFGTLLGGTE